MAAQAAVPDRSDPQRDPSLTTLVRTVLLAAALVSLLVAIWLVVRRLLGPTPQPLPLPTLGAVCLVLVAITSGVRLGWLQLSRRSWDHWPLALSLQLCSFTTVLLVALSVSITATTSWILFWAVLSAVEGYWWFIVWRVFRGRYRQSASPSTSVVDTRSPSAAEHDTVSVDVAAADDAFVESEGDLSEDVSQQLTRSNSEQVGDTVAGVLRGHFQPGERSRSLHVAFCPPMKSRPKVEVIQMTGPQARVKAADVQQFGVRFDLRLAAPSQQTENVLIHFEARVEETTCDSVLPELK